MNPSAQILLELDARFVFRVDASPKIGVGHVMRCVAVAEILDQLGFSMTFIGITSNIDWLERKIDAIPRANRVTSEKEFIIRTGRDILILDSYDIKPNSAFVRNANWLSRIAIVDNSTPNYLADIYIHPGPNFGWKLPLRNSESPILQGTKYIPVRKTISELNYEYPSSLGKTVVIVVAGGTDPTNFIEEIIPLLSSFNEDFEARIFTSNEKLSITDSRFIKHCPGTNLEASLVDSNIVLTTGGTTSWEIASLGIPMGIAEAVENQKPNYLFFTENNLAIGIGSNSDSLKKWNFDKGKLKQLLTTRKFHSQMIQNQLALQIRNGSMNIASDMIDELVSILRKKNHESEY